MFRAGNERECHECCLERSPGIDQTLAIGRYLAAVKRLPLAIHPICEAAPRVVEGPGHCEHDIPSDIPPEWNDAYR